MPVRFALVLLASLGRLPWRRPRSSRLSMVPTSFRARFKPNHVSWGLGIFALAAMSAVGCCLLTLIVGCQLRLIGDCLRESQYSVT